MAFVLLGELLGVGLAITVARLGTDLFYGVSARDPAVLAAVTMFVFLVSLGSAAWPAWHAAGKSPKAFLRAG
jgi:ABC-type antimicrobial peptide transport system permease subunit